MVTTERFVLVVAAGFAGTALVLAASRSCGDDQQTDRAVVDESGQQPIADDEDHQSLNEVYLRLAALERRVTELEDVGSPSAWGLDEEGDSDELAQPADREAIQDIVQEAVVADRERRATERFARSTYAIDTSLNEFSEVAQLGGGEVDMLREIIHQVRRDVRDLQAAVEAGEMTQEEKREAVGELRGEADTRIEEILSPEQLQLFLEMRTWRKGKRKPTP